MVMIARRAPGRLGQERVRCVPVQGFGRVRRRHHGDHPETRGDGPVPGVSIGRELCSQDYLRARNGKHTWKSPSTAGKWSYGRNVRGGWDAIVRFTHRTAATRTP